MKCKNCEKELTKIQISKKQEFCSKGCATSYRKSANDPDFFEIEEEIKYYLLGLLFTDGNLDKNESRLTLSLTNKEVIKFLYPYFSNTEKRKIYEYQPKTVNAKKTYTIINTNKKSIEKIKNMGLESHNSSNKTIPKINDKYINSFIRGVFDGDGCVYISNTIKNKKYLAISITSGSEDFAYGIKEILVKIGLHPTIVIDSRRKNQKNKTYYVKLNKQNEIKFFKEYIYENAIIKNNEKYEKFCSENIV